MKIERIYDSSAQGEFRVLVDRLWPRGVHKNKVDLWMKDIAPSDELRKWFAHDSKKWPEFRKKYTAELRSKTEMLKQLKILQNRKKNLTLVYAAKDEKRNNAVVLKEMLMKK